MMTKGMEMMVNSIIKMLGLDAQLITNQIAGIAKSLHTIATNAETVRRQNSAIMAHLGIPEPLTPEQQHARDERAINGSAAGSA